MKKNKKRKKSKNTTKHFFCDSYISIIIFIIYLVINIVSFKVFDFGSLGIVFILSLLSYCSALVLPEYVDKKCNHSSSKILMWLMRIMFVLGYIYALNDIFQSCTFMCFNGIYALAALIGLVIIPFVIMIIYTIIYCFCIK